MLALTCRILKYEYHCKLQRYQQRFSGVVVLDVTANLKTNYTYEKQKMSEVQLPRPPLPIPATDVMV